MRIRNKKTGEIKEVSIKELNQYGLGGSVYVKNKLTKLPVFMEEGGEVINLNPNNPVILKEVVIKGKKPPQSNVLTYASNPDYFDSRTIISQDPKYNAQIKKGVYAGTHGYDPTTGYLVRLETPIKVDPVTREMSTEEWGKKSDAQRFSSRTPAGEQVRKNYVAQDMQKVVSNPITYAPGLAAAAVLGAPALSTVLTSALSAPLTVGATTVPWLTPGTMIGAGFGLHGANQLGNQLSSGYYSSNAPTSEKIFTGVTTGLDMLGTPGVVEALGSHVVSPLYRGALEVGNYLSKNKVLRNASKTMPEIAPIINPTVTPWTMQESSGLQLQSTMDNGAISKIVEPKSGLVNTEQALAIIAKESGGADKVALIKQGLGENIPKKINYNEFRKVVQNQLIPLEINFTEHASNYGLGKIGYPSPKRSTYEAVINNTNRDIQNLTNKINELKSNPANASMLPEYQTRLDETYAQLAKNQEGLNSLPLENKTLLFSNEGKFGRGSHAHNNPHNTLGHVHYLVDAKTPDIFTVTQIQSDAFQGSNRIMPKNIKEAIEKLNNFKDEGKLTKNIFNDGSESSNRVIANYEKHLQLEEASIKNFTQKSLLDKNHQERYLQEIVNYAAKRGNMNKVRVPTSETAAKVQGYAPKKSWNVNLNEGDEVTLLDGSKGIVTDNTFDNHIKITKTDGTKVNIDFSDSGHGPSKTLPVKFINNVELKEVSKFTPESQTILKKYSELPKTIKKLFGQDVKIVTDSKNNSWYEFDIPKSFKEGRGQIKAFKHGGIIEDDMGQWLDEYKEGGKVINPKNPVQLPNVNFVFKRPVVKSTFNPYANINRIGTSDNTKVFRLNPDQAENAKKAAAIRNEKIVKEYQQRQSFIGPDNRTKAEIAKGIALKKEYDRVIAMQNSDLAKTFASFTPGNNIEAGVMGAETFANLNPIISGPILATSRLAPAILHPTNNAYWGSGRSNLENGLGVLGAIGDITMISPSLKISLAGIKNPFKNKKGIVKNNVVKIPKNKEQSKSLSEAFSDMFPESEEKRSFGSMVADEIETGNFLKNYNKNFKKRYKDYSDFKKKYTDFYNEQVNVFGRTPEEVDPEGIMKDFSNPDYLNDVLGFNTFPNARKNIAEGFLGDYSSAYINGKLNQGGRQLLSESGPDILDGLFKREADNFGKYKQVKPWEIFDKNHFIRQNKYGGIIKDDMGQWAHPGQVTKINSNQITMQGVPYPVLGVDNLGNEMLMQPEMDYTFPGQYVTEYPMMQKGGLVKYQTGRLVKKSFRDQLLERMGPIVDVSAAPIVLPPNLRYDKTRVVNGPSAGLTKTQLKTAYQYLKKEAELKKIQKLADYKAAKLFHENNPVAKVLGTRKSKPTTVKPTQRELAYGLGAGINDFYDVPGIGIANDFVNPLSLVSKGMISPWAQAPLQAQQSDSYLPYLGAAVSTALTIPMVRPATIATKTFLNPRNIYTGALKTGEYLTTQTPLKNTFKINPLAEKLNSANKSYRIAGMDAAEDFQKTGFLRSNPTIVPANFAENFAGTRTTGFPSFQKGYADLRYLPEEGGVIFETSLPTFRRGDINPVTGNVIKGRHYAHRVIDPVTGKVVTNIPGKDIRMFEGKPHWLKGYPQIKVPKQSIDPKLGKVLNKQGLINPVEIVDRIVPRINPFSFIEDGPDVMSFSPLNFIPGYGKKLSGTKNQAFRKFGNSIQDVAQRQALSPAGGSKFKMGKNQILKEGNWAALENPWEKYSGVFEATFDKTVPNNNLSFLQGSSRSGVLIRDAKGNFLPEIPLTEPGMQLNRRLPFSTRYVPINKQKLIDGEFQLATQLPHLQSLTEKYGILAAGAGGLGYFVNGKKGAKENIKTLNKYTIDPIIKLYQKADKELNKGPKIYYKNGGQLKK